MLDKEIMDLVNKNLPSLAVKTLEDYFSKSAKIEKELDLAIKGYEHKSQQYEEEVKKVKSLTDAVNSYTKRLTSIEIKETELLKREFEISKREVTYEVLNTRLSCKVEELNSVKDLVGVVFRNKEMISRSYSTPVTQKCYDYSGKVTSEVCNNQLGNENIIKEQQ